MLSTIPAPEADKHDHTLRPLRSTSSQHGEFQSKEREPVSTLTVRAAWQMADHTPSLYLDRTSRFTSISAHTADLRHHTGITLQVVPRMKYALRLLVDNEERTLRRINNGTWEPTQPLYAPRFFDTYT